MPNQVFIALNIVFCLIITVIAVLPQIQSYNPYEDVILISLYFNYFSSSGLVQTSFISFYSTYLVWSSVSSNPAHGGNELILRKFIRFYFLAPQCNPSIFRISTDAIPQESVPKDSMNWASIVGMKKISILSNNIFYLK